MKFGQTNRGSIFTFKRVGFGQLKKGSNMRVQFL